MQVFGSFYFQAGLLAFALLMYALFIRDYAREQPQALRSTVIGLIFATASILGAMLALTFHVCAVLTNL